MQNQDVAFLREVQKDLENLGNQTNPQSTCLLEVKAKSVAEKMKMKIGAPLSEIGGNDPERKRSRREGRQQGAERLGRGGGRGDGKRRCGGVEGGE